ncbi:MAG: hypothetical protein DRI54_08315 [Bacteroidetes bacterium]|nr:MAG: hypothetical protein DRI54_08315 [Bacteroidota bacterium]
MSREEKSNMMLSLVEQWQQSGQSQSGFARENNINVFTLRYWIDKSRQENDGGSSFIQINASGGTPVCLRYPNGVELLLPVNTPVVFIKGLIQLF